MCDVALVCVRCVCCARRGHCVYCEDCFRLGVMHVACLVMCVVRVKFCACCVS